MTEDELKAEISRLREQAAEAARPFNERADYLQKVLNGPGVTPVVHYMCYRSKYEAAHYADDMVSAFHSCDHMIESGEASPIGVSVGGALVTREEWKTDPRRPRNEQWLYV